MTLVAAVLALSVQAAEPEMAPIDVLKTHIEAGIAVLNDTRYADAAAHAAQRDELCAIANEMFDIYAFSRLVLAGNWRDFEQPQQAEFVQVFGDFLCRYYLSRLQARYSNEQVTFSRQRMTADNRALVSASVRWNDLDVPVEVRMAHREGRWRAYDIVVAGISAVLLYRTQFEAALLASSPAGVIADLRRRIEEQG